MSVPLSNALRIYAAGLLSAGALLAGASPLHALPAEELEEVVVTARYRDTSLLDSIGSVSVVTDRAIRERAALHLEELLQGSPNVSWSAGS